MDGNHRWPKHAACRVPSAIAPARRTFVPSRKPVRTRVSSSSLFALSTENLDRPKREVNLLLDLMRRFLEDNVDELAERGVRFARDR